MCIVCHRVIVSYSSVIVSSKITDGRNRIKTRKIRTPQNRSDARNLSPKNKIIVSYRHYVFPFDSVHSMSFNITSTQSQILPSTEKLHDRSGCTQLWIRTISCRASGVSATVQSSPYPAYVTATIINNFTLNPCKTPPTLFLRGLSLKRRCNCEWNRH